MGAKFKYKDNAFYCNECTSVVAKAEVSAKLCRGCKERITTAEIVEACGGHYHPEHFVCTVCKTGFPDGSYIELNGFPYCSEHAALSGADLCSYCTKPIKLVDRVKVQGGESYHAACMRCHTCGCRVEDVDPDKKQEIYCKGLTDRFGLPASSLLFSCCVVLTPSPLACACVAFRWPHVLRD